MAALDLYHLPGWSGNERVDYWTLRFGAGAVELRYPRLTPLHLAAVIDRLKDARAMYLSRLPVARVVELVDRAISRWLDPFSPYRRQAERLLPLVTGYAEPAIRKGLTGYLASFRAENLSRLLAEEFPDPRVLDEFRPRPRHGGFTRAYGPTLVTHVFSGNVPGLPAQSLASALLVKSASLGKVASDEPVFAALFAQSLKEVDPRLADCLAVTYWPGGERALETMAFSRSEAVIAYGSVSAIQNLQARVPRTVRFIPYGHKLSFGLIGRECLGEREAPEIAARAGYDVAKYDQQSCLSPHVFYVEEGGGVDPPGFARLLAKAMESHQAGVPRGRLSPEEAASIRQALIPYELGAQGCELHQSADGLDWAVIYDPDPAFVPSCLNRVIRVKPIPDLERVWDVIAPFRNYFQTVGLAVDEDRLFTIVERLGEMGVDRICPLGQMGDPSPGWHHDGRLNLIELVRWADLEAENLAGRWEFSHPERGLYGESRESAGGGERDGG